MTHHPPTDTELAVLAVRVAAALLDRQIKVATAESCTGGYVAKLLTDVPGSSDWFECGLVTYSNESKQRQLGVSAATLADHGAVSERAVLEMAVGALVASGAQLAVAISGVAGPDGGTDEHPVGDVWFARAARHQDDSVGAVAVHRRFSGDRDAVRRHSAAFTMDLVLEG
ncbi:MAG: nicotinamide-nucleotide amidohydrolase family protein [Steroidobacteraceae bacterium]